jgi:hypothetical protein
MLQVQTLPPVFAPLQALSQLFQRPQAETSTHGTFVTQLGKGKAALALTLRSQQALAYCCDGDSLAEWFQGEVNSDGTLQLVSARHAKLEVQVGSRQITGKLTLPLAQAQAFKAAMVSTQGNAGLYRAKKNLGGIEYLGGWIILPNGKQVGAVRCGRSVVSRPWLNPENPVVRVTSVLSLEAKRLKAFQSKQSVILPPLGTPSPSERSTWSALPEFNSLDGDQQPLEFAQVVVA